MKQGLSKGELFDEAEHLQEEQQELHAEKPCAAPSTQ
jgi:hypothetical protein